MGMGMGARFSPLASYLAIEVMLLILIRFIPANGIWLLLVGFLAIGFVGALVFRERPLENSRALIASSGIVFAIFWAYIFATLIFATLSNPGIIPDSLRQALRANAAGNVLGAIPNVAGAMLTSWIICLMLAIAGNTLGARVRRLVRL